MALKPLIGFGLGIIGAGFMWRMYNDTITSFFSSYIVDLNDKYYLLSDMIWEALPIIIIFLGVVCLIFGGMTSGSGVGGEQ
jgi:hypothetical protein